MDLDNKLIKSLLRVLDPLHIAYAKFEEPYVLTYSLLSGDKTSLYKMNIWAVIVGHLALIIYIEYSLQNFLHSLAK